MIVSRYRLIVEDCECKYDVMDPIEAKKSGKRKPLDGPNGKQSFQKSGRKSNRSHSVFRSEIEPNRSAAIQGEKTKTNKKVAPAQNGIPVSFLNLEAIILCVKFFRFLESTCSYTSLKNKHVAHKNFKGLISHTGVFCDLHL